jgi:multidrug efflux pump subunit AcrA (membrane-fusion protein)
VEVWCEIPNGEARLRAGVFGTVEFVTGRLEHAVMAPVAAVQFEEGTRKGFVMVAGADGKAHRRSVETGAEQGGRVPVLKGLKAGEAVIVEGGYGLPDGTAVKLAEGPGK